MHKRLKFARVVFPAVLFVSVSAGWITGQTWQGTPGVADRKAVADVCALAQRQENASPADQQFQADPGPMPIPHNLPVPAEAMRTTDSRFQGPPPRATGQAISLASPPTVIDFMALGDDNTRIPPDTHGAVGKSHLMVTLSSQVRIQNRSGGRICPDISLNDFWSPVRPPVPPDLYAPKVFDPKVLYDSYNNRWITTVVSDSHTDTASLLLAVSDTYDPTGAWNFYRVKVYKNNDKVWADYPSIGFNKNWICVQVNTFGMNTFGHRWDVVGFSSTASTFAGSHIYCFNKAKLYAGGPGEYVLISVDTIGGTQVPAVTYDNNLDTLFLLQTYNSNSSGNGFLRLYTITGPVDNPILKSAGYPGALPWEPCVKSGELCLENIAPQLDFFADYDFPIDAGDTRMLQVIYRNGTLWATHTVFLPTGTADRSSVQWWNLNTAGGVLQFGRIDNALTFYAYPSIAVNKNNDVLIGYSRFSADQYASANFSYRAGDDSPNTLRPDAVLRKGDTTYKNIESDSRQRRRWGDYSNTVVDPLDDKTLWTIQEYAAHRSGDPLKDKWGTWWGRIGYEAGDIDNDGAFTPADVGLELECVFAGACPLPNSAYDMDCDGIPTPYDVIILLLLVHSKIPPPC